jgi:hypothetical protein
MRKSKEATDIAPRVAKHGDKMISITLNFWTNDIADRKGDIMPKHAWDAGMLALHASQDYSVVVPDSEARRDHAQDAEPSGRGGVPARLLPACCGCLGRPDWLHQGRAEIVVRGTEHGTLQSLPC